jgi:hypothetical protein
MINPGWRGEYYLQQDLEGHRKRLKRLVGSHHLEPAMRQRIRHFEMELDAIPPGEEPRKRDDRELLEEILELVRSKMTLFFLW